jgi:tetratricopeptide (TPR) repeat protein
MVQQSPPVVDPDALTRTALGLFEAGRGEAAEECCRAALTANAGHIGALSVLGLTLHAAARHVEAERAFAELTRLDSREPTHWMNLGTSRRLLGRLDEALTAYLRAAQLGLATADFFYNIGLAHLDRRDYEAAHAVLARALQLAPQDAAVRFEYARACYESMRAEEAAAALEGWEKLEGIDESHAADAGHRLMNLGESERAEAALRRVRHVRNLEPRAQLTLAQIFERTNRIAQAREVIEALTTQPAAAQLGADLSLTEALLAQRESRHERACELFGQALAQLREPHERHAALFPLAQSLDALGRFDEAFETATQAHRSQFAYLRLTAPLAVARGAPTMRIAEYACDSGDVASWDDTGAPSSAQSPIFIVAFPRSGTTLLELTLDAHPALVSMDEQPFVQNALDDLVATGARYPEQLGRLTPAQLEEVRKRYWQRVRRKVRLESGQRLVDKNPLNLLRLPAIRRLFPNARILLAVRHPCDVLLSCYMQHFRAPEFALLCADLESLARGHARAFEFWYAHERLLAPAAREVRYETFVADFERETRAIAEFLELPWDEAMLAPGRRAQEKGYISTPSYSQVVQPVNSRSVGRWRGYRRHLDRVAPIVQPCIDRWGYDAPGSVKSR